MIIVGHKVNPVLKEHILRIGKLPLDEFYIGDTLKDFIFIANRLRLMKGEILVYNTSITNLILLVLLRFRGKCHITFHLHDPIPHSGWKNPIIFVVNFLSVRLCHKVAVFSEYVANQTEKYYGKSPLILSHGFNDFNLLDYDYSDRLGVFGRNMPYKNFGGILKSFKGEKLVVVGKGYDEIAENEMIKHYSGFVPNDVYYSIMFSVRAVIVLHQAVSYSGVISDSMKLGKYIIGNSLVEEHVRGYDRFIHYREFSNTDVCTLKTSILDKSIFGWDQYRKELSELW